MSLGRRGFLGSLLGAASAAVLAPEELLWKPKRYVGGFSLEPSTNVFVDPNWLAEEYLRVLSNQLQVAKQFKVEYDSHRIGKRFGFGDVVNVPFPARWTA